MNQLGTALLYLGRLCRSIRLSLSNRTAKDRFRFIRRTSHVLACENIRFSSLFAAGDVSRNVPSGEERGEMDVFAGYTCAEPNA